MMCNLKLLQLIVILCNLVYFGNSKGLPSRFKVCKRNDPKLDKCFKEAFQIALRELKNGIPELNIPSDDPLDIEDIRIDAGSNAAKLNQHYIKPKFFGFSKIITTNIGTFLNDTNMMLKVSLSVSSVALLSKYEFKGKLTALEINGNGDFAWEVYNNTMQCKLSGSTYEKKGQVFMMMDDVDVHYKVGKAHFKIDNLFGNELLSKEINHALNENWYEVQNELQPAIELVLNKVIKGYANNILEKVPYGLLVPIK